jgi:hypothetical protein
MGTRLETGCAEYCGRMLSLCRKKWHKWSENPKSICQRILNAIGVLKGFTKEEYWLGVARTMTNDKLCAMRSNMKQAMFEQFKGMFCFLSNYCRTQFAILTSHLLCLCQRTN